ncbi:uncharacterized protein PFL1_01258 [Pseudozyma flocculosa PF-1]|uniref:uncharacterized protein n=1 Tax=Pseudozyma flocculosa PF-1 TaxID=1277687 RepID=UPI0004560F61|nr:uncharacterized protein PFL1_01258 [Pseudozyma flocculosa PF-1]EPQ31069.1 hypothetical protein PFL1_01258 [Pseudozyma flocculosa PF-1]
MAYAPAVHRDGDAAAQASRILADTQVSPAIISALIRRVKALTSRLIDREVDEDTITSTEGLVTPAVVSAFHEIGGDFGDAAQSHLCLTKKFRRIEADGDVSLPTSALESAIDQHTTILLSSTESQKVVGAIWSGDLVQRYGPDGYSYFEPYEARDDGAFLAHFDPARLAVPRYSYVINITIWIFFLVLFTVQTRTYKEFDLAEGLLWVMAAGYIIEDASRWIKIGGIDSITFWTVLDVATNGLFLVSFSLRIASFVAHGHAAADLYQLRAFQFLACVAPLVWIQLLKLFDGFVYFGILQVIILRMAKETAIFFTLLALVMVGFFHAFYALDAADESRIDDAVVKIIDNLTQTLLGGADFDLFSDQSIFSKVLYQAYCFLIAVILLNVLVAFFGTAYSDVVESAHDTYAGFFSEKVIGMVRAPDQYVYLAPFNLIEVFLIAPLEYVLPRHAYARLNYGIQSVVFGLPLFLIAFYESRLARKVGAIMLQEPESELDEARGAGIGGTIEDPEIPQDEQMPGLRLARTRFDDILAMALEGSGKH